MHRHVRCVFLRCFSKYAASKLCRSCYRASVCSRGTRAGYTQSSNPLASMDVLQPLASMDMSSYVTFILQLHRGHLNGLQVAIKQLRSGTCDSEIAEQLLLEEAALMQVRLTPSLTYYIFTKLTNNKRLNHSAILHVFGCVRGAGRPLQMVMELCDGGSLFERIHRQF